MAQPINPKDLIKIEMLDPPMEFEKGEGLYEWSVATGAVPYTVDIVDLKKDIENVLPGKSERILDRLQNFKMVYINLRTGEVST